MTPAALLEQALVRQALVDEIASCEKDELRRAFQLPRTELTRRLAS